MKSVFSTYHPIINFGFFLAVIGIGIFMQHPVLVAIAMIASLSYAVMLGGRGAVKFAVCFVLPMILVFIAVNILVNPRGETALFLSEYRAYTLEAAIYGCVAGFMLGTVLLWFSCYNKIMTGDKFAYLFGRITPAISLIFSMVMRFVPNFKMQMQKIANAQKCIGRNVTDGKIKEKVHHGMRLLSIMMTWALENAIDSADSMRSRGYGLKDRSIFSIYRFDVRDIAAAVFLVIMTVIVLIGVAMGKCSVEFYPTIIMERIDAVTVIVFAAYAALCFFPIAVELKEAVAWKLSQSKI